MKNEKVVRGLKPKLFWEYLASISEIPRGSGNEAGIRTFVLEVARTFLLETKVDATGNVLVKVPASKGMESRPIVVLQGHMDMVCKKNEDVVHDFLVDPIELVRQGDKIRANGTTAGFDNGVAIASMLAIIADKNVVHGPLELLLTVDEETGLTGAFNLEPGFVEGRILINLDSEEDWVLYVGCAGGKDITGELPIDRTSVPRNMIACQLSITGLPGGHSGCEIHKGRPNAIKILARVLSSLEEPVLGVRGMRISTIKAGDVRNAIPSSAKAIIFLFGDSVSEAARVVEGWEETIKEEYRRKSGKLSIRLLVFEEYSIANKSVINLVQQASILRVLKALPHGVVKMSEDVRGLVETSTNLAIVRVSHKNAAISLNSRSSSQSGILDAYDTVKSVLKLGKFSVNESGSYPGWKPNMKSPILKLARIVYEKQFGDKAKVKAIHAGLECGVIGSHYEGMDMLSFGPTLKEVHTPNENVSIKSICKFWQMLTALLVEIQ